ncbi:MAG: hypothetical protein AUJ47_09480 [Candidatus Marinimicrobia bacterium CG1_02_48_14]|nr:MAG: hypothetical protein AUJ47_09480 [Candidatus Marinimicrobia bacterium CG1_02_48_14]
MRGQIYHLLGEIIGFPDMLAATNPPQQWAICSRNASEPAGYNHSCVTDARNCGKRSQIGGKRVK